MDSSGAFTPLVPFDIFHSRSLSRRRRETRGNQYNRNFLGPVAVLQRVWEAPSTSARPRRTPYRGVFVLSSSDRDESFEHFVVTRENDGSRSSPSPDNAVSDVCVAPPPRPVATKRSMVLPASFTYKAFRSESRTGVIFDLQKIRVKQFV